MPGGLLALVAMWAAAPAAAQTASPSPGTDDAATERRPPIIVTGQGLERGIGDPAYATVVIDVDALRRAASGRIEDVLAGVAGFQQFRRSDSRASNPSAQGATLRALGGNATSRSLVLLDGVPQANPFFGYIPFSAFDPATLGSIEVTRGGGSGAFGAGAVAGTIAMNSAGIERLDPLRVSALVSDRGGTELSAVAAAPLGAGFAVASGRWDRGQGFFTTPEDQRGRASVRAAYDSWSAALRGVAPLGEQMELQARIGFFDDRRTLRFEGADSRSSGQDVSLRVVGDGDWKLDALAYVQLRDFSNVVISSSQFTRVLDQRSTPATGIGGKIELRPPVGGGHMLRFGADLRISDGELREVAFSAFTGSVTARRSAGGRNTDLGLFLEDDWQIGRLVLTAGARLDRWTIADGFFAERDGGGSVVIDESYANRSGWDESLRAGALFDLGAGLRLRASAYSGVRLPTLNELYRPFVVFPVETMANPALANERLRGFEAGIDYRGDALDFSLTAFDNRLRNAVTNVTIGTDLRQRRNINAIEARGIELDGAWRLGRVSLVGSLALIDAENDARGAAADLDGLRPAQTPRWAASLTGAWEPAEGWDLSATLRHEGARFEDDLNSDILPAATTLDAVAALPLIGGVSLVLRGENLFDERIVTRNQGGSIDLGTPRTLWIGLRTAISRRSAQESR